MDLRYFHNETFASTLPVLLLKDQNRLNKHSFTISSLPGSNRQGWHTALPVASPLLYNCCSWEHFWAVYQLFLPCTQVHKHTATVQLRKAGFFTSLRNIPQILLGLIATLRRKSPFNIKYNCFGICKR